MSGLGTLIRSLAGERGIELDQDELDQLGLSDDETGGTVDPGGNVLAQELPGKAAGRIELFLDSDSLSTTTTIPSKDGLMWEPIIRSGQWAVRPGTNGKKRRVPLKVVSGKSKNQRREIGLEDIVEAFDDDAVQHVTVPLSHNNTLTENQGFIDKLKIVDGEVKDLKTKKMVPTKVLLGGYRITEPETKGKMERSTYANRSAGLLYDYVNTETGKSYGVVLEHVALTNKPWITGMANFGRKLAGVTEKLDTVSLSLSDEGPDEDEYLLVLSQELELDEVDSDFLAQESTDWSKEGSPNWLRQQVNSLLEEARAKKLAARRVANANAVTLYDDYPPSYRCVEAKPGKALISDGWGEDVNYWAAPITVKDGAVELSAFDQWSQLKKAFIPDERPAPAADKLPLSERDKAGSTSETEEPKLTRLQLAQRARRERARGAGTDNNPREVVGNMAGENGTLTLSEEAQRVIQEVEAKAEARIAAAEGRAEKLSQRVERLTGTVQSGEVDTFINRLKAPKDEGGLGLSEEAGFGGVLTVVRDLMLADDGEPAVQSEKFTTDANKDGELSLSESIKSIFSALEKVQEGKAAVGEQLSQPADAEKPKVDAEGNPITPEAGTNAGEPVGDGKPAGSSDPEGETLSTEERVKKIREASPSLAALTGHRPGATTTPTPDGGDK